MSPLVPRNIVEPAPLETTAPKTSEATQLTESSATQRLLAETAEEKKPIKNGALARVIA